MLRKDLNKFVILTENRITQHELMKLSRRLWSIASQLKQNYDWKMFILATNIHSHKNHIIIC